MKKPLRILYLEDEPLDGELVARALAVGGLDCELEYARTKEEFESALKKKGFDAILSDYSIPGYGGLHALAAARTIQPNVPFLILSGTMGEVRAVESLRSGATDYVLKERLERLTPALRRALHEAQLMRAQREAEETLRRSEAQLAEAQRLGKYGSWSLDVPMDKLTWSAELYRIFGVEKPAFGESYEAFLAFVHPDDRERVLKTSVLARTEGKPFEIEYRITRPGGETRVIHELGDATRGQTGKVTRLFGTAQDVSGRKEAETQLRESDERFRSVWENSIDGMRLTDHAGRIVDVNEAFCRFVKIPRARLLGQVFSVMYKGHGPDDGLDVYQQRFASGQVPPRITARVQFWNSEDVDLEISSSFIELGSRGKLLLSIFRDITERKHAESRLAAFSLLGQKLGVAGTAREAAEVLAEVADQLLGWDAFTFALYSEAEDKLHHALNLDTIEGRRKECPPAYDHEAPSSVARRVIAEGAQLILKENPQQKLPDSMAFGDTARPSASILFVPIRNGAKVTGVLSIHSYTPKAYDRRSLETLQALADHCGEALERIVAQETLQATQTRLDHLLTQSPVVIYSFKNDGDTVRPAWVSNYIHHLLGFSPAEACQPSWWREHIHPQDRQAVNEGLAQLLARKQIVRDYRLRHHNGDYRWVRDEQRLITDADGQPVEIIGSWIDITDRKHLEEQLRQAQKLEAIGQLAGGVAHDFNNLLLVMRGNAELLLMSAEEHSTEVNEGLNQIIAAAERAANLTRQLLAFSRKQVMQSQPLGLNDLVANLTKMLKRIIGEDIQLQCQYAALCPSRCGHDRTSAGQPGR